MFILFFICVNHDHLRHLRAKNTLIILTKTSQFFKLLMGIRFYCPNGHKLNVKEKLAGKRGICPQCGVKLLIPPKSTRPSSREERTQQDLLAGGAGGNPNDFDVFTAYRPAETFGGHGVTALPSSAGDDSNVVWYVQFPDGQRYGPATLPIIQSWIQERRISPTMLVWREDWQDWLEARHVFPEVEQIFQKAKSQKSKNATIPLKNSFDDQRLGTGENTQRSSAIMIAVAILFILIFCGVLLYILNVFGNS